MLNVVLVGPLPPPAGGMAMQCRQLERLLAAEGIVVRVVQSNAPYRPRWIGRVWGARALFRLPPYLHALWRACESADVMHVLANSGWAWHLFAAPAVWIARLKGVPVIVNYRGGDAERFFRNSPWLPTRTMRAADACVVPSAFLQGIFGRCGIQTRIIANILDLTEFQPQAVRERTHHAPHVVVARNLEAIYDIETALRAFSIMAERVPNARLTVAGEGPERTRLEMLARELGIEGRMSFAGRLDRDGMLKLYASADLMLNPSTIDNMPNSILEAYAAGVPIVSTNVGGIPYIVRDGETALLVAARDARAMAEAACRVLLDGDMAARLREQGLREARRYSWREVRSLWLALYEQLVSQRNQAVAEQR